MTLVIKTISLEFKKNETRNKNTLGSKTMTLEIKTIALGSKAIILVIKTMTLGSKTMTLVIKTITLQSKTITLGIEKQRTEYARNNQTLNHKTKTTNKHTHKLTKE